MIEPANLELAFWKASRGKRTRDDQRAYAAKGMDFLGLRVYPTGLRASKSSLARFKRKMRIYDHEWVCGFWGEREYQERMTALTAFLEEADTRSWRRRFLGYRRGASGSNRVQRGGSWNNNAQNCRSANRNNNNPSNNNNNGFRLCLGSAALQPAPQEGDVIAVPADGLSAAQAAAKTTGLSAAGSAPEAHERRARAAFSMEGDRRVAFLVAIGCNRQQLKF